MWINQNIYLEQNIYSKNVFVQDIQKRIHASFFMKNLRLTQDLHQTQLFEPFLFTQKEANRKVRLSCFCFHFVLENTSD